MQTKKESYVISPFVVIRYMREKDAFEIKNKLHKDSLVVLHGLNELEINALTKNNNIFIKYSDIKKEKERGFFLLEKTFRQSKDVIGYIETTSICPYKCRMCPKGNNLLIRKNSYMEMEKFRHIVSQLQYQKDVALHLFGDPMCDEEIYEKIIYANKFKIAPSMSVNLISMRNFDLEKIKKTNLSTLIVSCDSFQEKSMSEIRGRTRQEVLNEAIAKLRKTIDLNEKKRFIKLIIIQSVRLNVNRNERMQIRERIKNYKRVCFYEKAFISFPMVEATYMKEKDELGDNGGWYFIYNLLERKLPFKCLKVWSKKEYGINSDGDIVPCCLSFNDSCQLGNCCTENLYDIYKSSKMGKFRENIYQSADCGKICNECNVMNSKIKMPGVTKKEIKRLQSFCIEKWP